MDSTPSSPKRLSLHQPSDLRRTLSHVSLRRKSAYLADLISGHAHAGAYDGEDKQALAKGAVGNGVRTWYSTFTTIDWLHDQCKEGYRQEKLREKPGIRGTLAHQWDRFQGWVAISLTGFLTACIAFCIISLEMWLFDIKDGYCTVAWWRAKRFCRCNPVSTLRMKTVQPTMRSAVSSRSFIQAWAKQGDEVGCEAWQEWSSVVDAQGSRAGRWMLEYGIYILMALVFATFASAMTIYLSASDSVVSTKDMKTDRETKIKCEEEDIVEPEQAKIPRTRSYQSYGAIDFGKRRGQARRQFSIDSSASFPLLSGSRDETPSATAAATPASKDHFETPVMAPRKIMYFAAGSGIPEIKTLMSGFVIRGYLGGWTLLAKSFGLCFSVGSGLSLGKEGPFVHIASCVGNIITRFFPKFDRNEAKRREILSAACAAGVAVSFGAPVGGVLFSLEEVSYFFPPKVTFRSFVCAMVAAVTLKLLDPFGSGKIVLFEVTYDKDFHWVEMIPFAFLGILGGLYGAIFNKANIAWTKHVRNGTMLKRHPILEVAFIVTLTALVSFLNPFTKMGGTELVYEMFSECNTDDPLGGLCVQLPSQVKPLVISILLALVAKALLTVITFGIKLPAGIFIPTLAVGACFGRILGLGVEYAFATNPESALFGFCRASGPLPAPFGQACVLPGVYSMVGAAATLAGVTRTTVSLAVIMFELTGTLTYVTPVMLAVLFAKTVADAIETRSIYDLTIEMNQLPYLDPKEEHVLSGSVADVVDGFAPLISLDDQNTVKSLQEKLNQHEGLVTGFPIIKDDEGIRLQGYVGFDELEQALHTFQMKVDTEVPPTPCSFRDTSARVHLKPSQEVEDGDSLANMLDLGYLIDRAPMTVSSRAPLQLLHQLFIKLGVRYLAVQDERGCYVGIIEKNRWLGYLTWLESKHK